jgi:uncharacterized repeat protein (TIGR03803 family)
MKKSRIAIACLAAVAALSSAPAGAQSYEVMKEFEGNLTPTSTLLRDSGGNLYGTALNDSVFKLAPDGRITFLHQFSYPDGSAPWGRLIADGDGNLYGTTTVGGPLGSGTVFKLAPDGTHTLLHAFGPDEGGVYPYGGVVRDGSGNLYGTTQGYVGDGAGQPGLVYKLAPDGAYTVLHRLSWEDGGQPMAELVLDAEGNLYGTARAGTVFKLSPDGTFAVLHTFQGSDGGAPLGGLILDGSGNLYGTASSGGTPAYPGFGTVFKLAADGAYTVLHQFNGADGATPSSALILDEGGNAYGTTQAGGAGGHGTVFKLAPDGTYTLLHSFTGADGDSPYGGLLRTAGGDLYGTTGLGGVSGYGTIFRIAADGSHTVLHSFGGADGVSPSDGVMEDASGILHGTTVGGGSGSGTIFNLTADGAYSIAHTFSGADGGSAYAPLIADSGGDLYGTTESGGGAGSYGTVFKLAPDGTYTVLHRFPDSTAAYPSGALALDGSGTVYGTIQQGPSAYGNVFKLTPDGTYVVLHEFDGTDGAYPLGGVVVDDLGTLYGTTVEGGASGYGTVFKVASDGTYTTLHSFDGNDGSGPGAAPVLDAAANLYGTTAQGGAFGYGTIFKLAPDGTYTLLHSFDGTDGAESGGRLVFDRAGTLYGTTSQGGPAHQGTVFQLTRDGTLTVLHTFVGADGSSPWTGVTIGRNGILYGATPGGGTLGGGVIFRITVDSDGDGILDPADNCALAANADQLDTDGDGRGNVCDADDDNDGVADSADNCKVVPNAAQTDTNGNGVGDVCDPATLEAVSAFAAAGVTVTTDAEGDGATPTDPVETSVTNPINGGTVDIAEMPVSVLAPAGFFFFGEQVSIAMPAATAANPIVIVFRLDSSILPAGATKDTIQVFRNGVQVLPCNAGPVPATPDPCVSNRATVGDDVQITVLTSAASLWSFGLPVAVNTPCTVLGAGVLATAGDAFAAAARFRPRDRVPEGTILYADEHAHLTLGSTAITRLSCTGNRAIVQGTGKVNGRAVSFTVGLIDGGPSGRGDRFEIQWPGYAAAAALRRGDVSVRLP